MSEEKKKYLVGVREIHISWREVMAASKLEAIDLVASGEDGDLCHEIELEYSHTLDKQYMTAELSGDQS